MRIGLSNSIAFEVTATFTGTDKSMGFRTGQEYKLFYFKKDGRYYISRRSFDAIAIPYDTLTALKKNWKITDGDYNV